MTTLLGNLSAMECLNQDTEFTLEGLITGSAALKSDCDEQLLMNFTINPNSAVKLQAIKFVSQAANSANRPTKVRIYLNERNVLFANVQGLAPREEVSLDWQPGADGTFVAVAPLPKCRFISAFHVSVFVMENEEDEDVTVVDGFDLLGDMAAGLGTSELPKGCGC